MHILDRLRSPVDERTKLVHGVFGILGLVAVVAGVGLAKGNSDYNHMVKRVTAQAHIDGFAGNPTEVANFGNKYEINELSIGRCSLLGVTAVGEIDDITDYAIDVNGVRRNGIGASSSVIVHVTNAAELQQLLPPGLC